MRIPFPNSLNRQFIAMVLIACLLVLTCSGFGLWSLIRNNDHILNLAEQKTNALLVLGRLDAIQQRLTLSYPKRQSALDPQLANSLDDQFNRALADARQRVPQLTASRAKALSDDWAIWLTAARNNTELDRRRFIPAQQQFASHLKVLHQRISALLEQQQIEAHATRKAAMLYTLIGGILGVLLGAWLIMQRVTRLSHGLHTLGRGMAIAAAGELDKRVNLHGCSELDALSAGFNYMASELEQQSHELRASEQGLLTVMNSAPDAIITIAMNGRVASWNAAAQRLFAYTAQDMLGKPLDTILDPSQRGDFARILSECQNFEALNDDHVAGPWEFTVRRKDGLHKPIEIILRDMIINGVKGLVVVGRDITERKATAEKMAFLTQHDSLTQLPNRSLIRDLLVLAMARAETSERLVGILAIGIDHFTDVNDNLGHALGDALLLSLTDRINDMLPRRNVFGRIGGDEYCITVDGMRHVDEVSKLADAITIALAKPFQLGGHDVFITLSMGISIYPFDDESPELLLKHASAAMYRCKREVNRNYLFYSDVMNTRSSGRIQMTAELKRALEKEQFRIYYQPQFDTKSGQLIGAEALLRWQHPERGLLPPNAFISVLEETGLIVPVGRWVMRQACAQSILWHQQGYGPLRISLNLSARQFKEEGFIEEVAKLIRNLKQEMLKAGSLTETTMACYDCMEFELTEGVLMEDTEASREILFALKEMGIKLSVDDFGTGYSSLSYLKQFPIDALKIDQSFVRDIGRSQDAELIVHAIIELAHNLRLVVVGEGVETQQHLDFLRDKGCDVVQGYIHGHAMPPEELGMLMKSRIAANS